MPRKKTGNKSSNKDCKKVKHVKSVTEKDPPIAGQPKNLNLNAIQKTFTFVKSEATPSSQLTQTVVAEHVAVNTKYSKRKIQSNWEKYEIPDDSYQSPESATARGYDFESLQNAGGGIGSHFKFKDERDWTEKLNSDSDSMNQLQSLNLNSLALSLSCIPFHQRLGIDPKYFTSKQISKFEAAAQLQQIKYQNTSFEPEKEEKVGIVKPTQELSSPFEIQPRLPISKDIQKVQVASDETRTSSQDILKIVHENQTPVDDELGDELDALLALNKEKVCNMCCIDIPKSALIPENMIMTPLIVKPQLSVPEIAAISKESFEDFLDSALEN